MHYNTVKLELSQWFWRDENVKSLRQQEQSQSMTKDVKLILIKKNYRKHYITLSTFSNRITINSIVVPPVSYLKQPPSLDVFICTISGCICKNNTKKRECTDDEQHLAIFAPSLVWSAVTVTPRHMQFRLQSLHHMLQFLRWKNVNMQSPYRSIKYNSFRKLKINIYIKNIT